MRQRDPNWRRSLSDDSGIIIGVLIAALVAVGIVMFWPKDETNPATAMRDNSPRTERAPVTPQSAPTKPAR
jgi:hypothetical protein